MQRLRVRYTKLGRVRFLSARDLTSVWERALRRAELPIAYSEGFSPHPKVSFPDALPVGYASTGEYAELTFAAEIDPGLLDEYERVRVACGGVGVARLNSKTCEGCHLQLSAVAFDRIRKEPADATVHCPECRRILVR